MFTVVLYLKSYPCSFNFHFEIHDDSFKVNF